MRDRGFIFLLLLLMTAPVTLTWGIAGEAAEAPTVNAAYIGSLVTQQVKIGPRYAGSDGADKTAKWIEQEAKKYPRFKVELQVFADTTVAGQFQFRNIIATVEGVNKEKFVVVAAHYDSKFFPDAETRKKFQGANDSASGVAGLLAMMQAIEKSKILPPCSLRFVFFDGEEFRDKYGPHDGLHGSRYYVQRLSARDLDNCRAMILLDMIGDKDLNLTLPRNSHEKLRARALADAAANKIAAEESTQNIIDDDLPFTSENIPTLNLIDFTYGEKNAYWHTAEDNLQNVSKESIKQVADLALRLLWGPLEK